MIIVITGPTCLGKSKTAINIAKKIDAEIVNGDAFQCYKQLNIGVAKPDEIDFHVVPHHLYSFVNVDSLYSIKEYQDNLRSKIDELLSKGKNIIIVGGSGLYIRSALYDYELLDEVSVDMSKYKNMNDEDLYNELKQLDSEACTKIHMNNRKRVLRAIEICLASGKTKTEIISSQKHVPIYDVKFFVKNLDRDILYERINKRVDEMIKLGLVDEVKNLMSKYKDDLRAFQAIGYKEIIDAIKSNSSIDDAIELIKQHTRNYAKRQLTFIRHQFPVSYYNDDEDLLRQING